MLLGSTRTENHPDGTGNLNSILNANWAVWNNAVNPANGLTASQSLFVVTASAAIFVADMVGATIKWDDGHTAIISGFTDSTHVTVGTSQTVAATTFDVYRADVIQAPYTLFARGLLKRARMLAGDDNARIRWSAALNRFVLVPAYEALTPTLNFGTDYTQVADFAGAEMSNIAMATGAMTLHITTSNLFAGMIKTIIIVKGSGGTGTLTFPAGWIFIGASAPPSIAASKTGIFKLHSTTTADSGVIATYGVQP